MNQEWKSRWVTALREGKYKQGKSVLRSNNRYCCLGVLCDITNLGDWGKNVEISESVYSYTIMGSKYIAFGSLHQEVLDATGLNRDNMLTLSTMNDKGVTFSKIADWIEMSE